MVLSHIYMKRRPKKRSRKKGLFIFKSTWTERLFIGFEIHLFICDVNSIYVTKYSLTATISTTTYYVFHLPQNEH